MEGHIISSFSISPFPELDRQSSVQIQSVNSIKKNFTGHGIWTHGSMISQDICQWPIIDPLPSYGRGRDLPGGRYSSCFIIVSNRTSTITMQSAISLHFDTCKFIKLLLFWCLISLSTPGDNGTINGQGQAWWDKFQSKELNFTRGYLVEIMYSSQILISNITLVDSPSWNLHPVYSRLEIIVIQFFFFFYPFVLLQN